MGVQLVAGMYVPGLVQKVLAQLLGLLLATEDPITTPDGIDLVCVALPH